jgi:hypothetical protein
MHNPILGIPPETATAIAIANSKTVRSYERIVQTSGERV